MKNNILIIVVVTLVAIGVIAAVIIAGAVKGSESSQPSNDIPDWGGSHASSGTWESSSQSASLSESVPVSTGENGSSNTEPPVESSSSASSGSSSSASTSSPVSDYSAAESIVATANSLIGVPFVMGGNSPDGFDNPGFIYYVLRENGFHSCSHSIAKQSTMGRQIGYEELKAGDLVFFGVDDNTAAVFGGIYIGEGKMVACITPTKGEPGVMTADITTPYYRHRFFCGVSLS